MLSCVSLLAYFERTRTPLTSFIHSFRFSMMFFSSAMLKPVSFCSWSTYVNAGLPLFLAPCFGSQSSRSLITSSFFLQQCPINRSLLIISVSVICVSRGMIMVSSFSDCQYYWFSHDFIKIQNYKVLWILLSFYFQQERMLAFGK